GGLLAANTRAAQLAGLPADAPVFIVYPAPEPLWKRALKAAVADAGVTGLDHLRALAGALSLEGPWALWTDMVSIR
ncbi:MAG: hypothetical protein CVU59_09660, partial [Deltaproteobacteria bacterium HGW-Deltaproteobacteria-17]